MKELIVTLTLIGTLCSANLSQAAERYVTLFQDSAGTTPLTQAVLAGEVAFILRFNMVGSTGDLGVTVGSYKWDISEHVPGRMGVSNHSHRQPFVIAGPCTITYTPHPNGTSRTLLTIKISPNPNIMGVKQ